MEPSKENKIRFVDALRGIAILGVLTIHCGNAGTNDYAPLFELMVLHGALGVQLFFVASAFTIFLTYGNRFSKEKNPVTNFFVRRFLRIAPMYYVGILYFLWQNGRGASYWLGDATGISTWNIAANVLFLHSLNPFWITSVVPGGWSIAVETSFYCLVPFLFLRIRNLSQAFTLFLVALLVRAALHLFFQDLPLITSERLWGEYLYFYPPEQFPVFACGIVLYYLVQTPLPDWRIDQRAGLVFAFLLLTQLTTRSAIIFPVHVQFAMACIVLGYALSRYEFLVLVNPITVFIGKISYSMYLVHFAVLHWLTKFGYLDLAPITLPFYSIFNFLLRFSCLGLLTVLISTITYHFIELPLQNLGRRIVRRRENQNVKSLGLA